MFYEQIRICKPIFQLANKVFEDLPKEICNVQNAFLSDVHVGSFGYETMAFVTFYAKARII